MKNFLSKLKSYRLYSPEKFQEEIKNHVAHALEDLSFPRKAAGEIETFYDNSYTAQMGQEHFQEYSTFQAEYQKYKAGLVEIHQANSEKFLSESFAFEYAGGYSFYAIDSLEQIRLFRAGARTKTIFDPHIKAIFDNHVQFVVGDGINIQIPHPDLDRLIQDEWNNNGMELNFRDWVGAAYRDGECPISCYINDGNFWLVRQEPDEILEIEKHPRDKSMTLGYKRTYNGLDGLKDEYFADINYYDLKAPRNEQSRRFAGKLSENKLMMFVRYGDLRRDRGVPQLMSVLRYAKLYEDLILDLALLLHERSKVVWILTIKDKKLTDREFRPPRGGTVKIETDSRTWRTENPKIQGYINAEYGRIIRLPLCAASGFPEYLIFGESRGANYSALRETSHPVMQMTVAHQIFWAYWLKMLFRKMLVEKKKAGIITQDKIRLKKPDIELMAERIGEQAKRDGALPTDTIELLKDLNAMLEGQKSTEISVEDIPIHIIWPKKVPANPLLRNQALQIEDQMRWTSKATIRKELGRESELEESLIKRDQKVMPPILPGKNGQTGPSRAPKNPSTETGVQNYDRKIGKDRQPSEAYDGNGNARKE